MLRTAGSLDPIRAFVAALRRSGFPWRRPPATEVAWSFLGQVLPLLVGHDFSWTHSELMSEIRRSPQLCSPQPRDSEYEVMVGRSQRY